jgi:Nitrate reductase delta subunit
VTQRWELLRALGAVADSPAAARAVAGPLGLDPPGDAEHTEVFVLNCPPYASVYLGPDGALGGEGADRVAGFWRAIAVSPPAEPDHLAALLALYASLGEAADQARRPATAEALTRSRHTLFAEHLWPWLPAYLDAVTDLTAPSPTAQPDPAAPSPTAQAGLTAPSLAGWVGLARRAVGAEFAAQPAGPRLPLALRAAPDDDWDGLAGLVGALTTPVRSGLILTRRRLAAGAGEAGVGHRIGERRYTLRAMVGQDPHATLTWAAAEAERWQQRHARRAAGDQVARWWAARAARTATLLRERATVHV